MSKMLGSVKQPEGPPAVWAVLPPGAEDQAAAALTAAGVMVDAVRPAATNWPNKLAPVLPESFVSRLDKGDRRAWHRYWLGACIFPLFPTSPSPAGPHPPNELWSDRTLLEDLRRSSRLHRRLRYFFSMVVRSEVEVSGEMTALGGRIAALWSDSEAPDGWAAFSVWAFPSHKRTLHQKTGSLVPLTSNTLDDPSFPREVELHVALGGEDRLEMPDGTRFLLGGDRLEIEGAERDYVIVVNGRNRQRLGGARLSLELSDAALHSFPDMTVLDEGRRQQENNLRHDYEIEPRAPRANEEVLARAWVPGSVPYEEVVLHFAAETPSRDGLFSQEILMVPEDRRPTGIQTRAYVARIPGHPSNSIVRYRIEARARGHTEFAADANPPHIYPDLEVPYVRPPLERFSYTVGPHRVPEWVRDAVIYHVLVDRFAAAEGKSLLGEEEVPWLGFAGGTIRGLIECLGYIADLGVNALWISPVFKAQMHVCYDVEDFFEVHPRLGTVADARDLCESAHSLGLRVILDFEPSYIGWKHPFHQAARTNRDSPYRQWFHWHRWPDRPFGWFGSRMLIALDHGHSPVRAHLLDAARFWLDVGFDGFRLDSAHASPLDFWTDFGKAVRQHSPEAFTIGEISLPLEDCLKFRGRLNGFLDFELCAALRKFLGDGSLSAYEIDEIVSRRNSLDKDFIGASFIENHDMDRFTFMAEEPARVRLKSALLTMMGMPDIPILYYGSEVGLGQRANGDVDLTVRPPMLWGDAQDSDLREYVRMLVAWRNSHPALRHGSYSAVRNSPAYVFVRRLGEDVVVVAANPTAGDVSIPIDPRWVGPDGLALDVNRRLSHLGGRLASQPGKAVELRLGPFESCYLSRS